MLKIPAAFVLTLAVASHLAGCAGERKRDPIVPDDMQRRSEERYGQQAQMMGGLNQTSAEQAAQRHENATRPVERDDEKPPRESRE